MQRSLTFVLLLLCCNLSAQTFKVSGRVTTSRLEPIAYVSVQIKNSRIGAVSKPDGHYELLLEEGQYEMIFSMIGYTSQSISVVVNKILEHNIILDEDMNALSEVVVTGRGKDRAEEIIRAVIRTKEAVLSAPGAYSFNFYVKAVQVDSFIRIKNKAKRSDKAEKAKDVNALSRMAMIEISARVDHGANNQIKEERRGVKQNGPTDGLFYLSATEGSFNLYNNLIQVPALSATPLLSPVSYSGLIAYRFKTIRVESIGKHKNYIISVRPRNTSNATVEGQITISDSGWTILHTRLLFPKYHLPVYDFFELVQDYGVVQQKAWMITRQQFTYNAKGGRKKVSGQTSVVYSHFEFNKQFGRRYFGPELSATTLEAYEKDSSFWQTARSVPLTEIEVRFIRYRDSLHRATNSLAYFDSIDRITNKITWKKLAYQGQTFYNREQQRTWNFPPVLSFFQPFGLGGLRISPTVYYAKTYKSRKNISVFTNVSYGLRNKDVNGSVRVGRLYNPFNRGYYTFSVSRGFQSIFNGDAWINQLKRSNYYLSNQLSAGHHVELVNGLFLYTNLEFALRRSVNNYKTGTLIDSLFERVLDNNSAIPFEPYNALYGEILLQYTPKQQYIREPREKIILGSKWPTFYVSLRKGLPGLMNSKVDFDYLEAGMEQQIKVGLAGVLRYTVKTGSFINKAGLRLVDYKFQRRGDPILYMNPDEAFQALDSTFPVFKQFYQGHFVHEFNGALLNKIPIFKKLNLREIAGVGFLLAPERKLRYAETFAGVERVFKWPFNPLTKFKLGVYIVGSAANQFANRAQFKVGVTSWDKNRNKWN